MTEAEIDRILAVIKEDFRLKSKDDAVKIVRVDDPLEAMRLIMGHAIDLASAVSILGKLTDQVAVNMDLRRHKVEFAFRTDERIGKGWKWKVLSYDIKMDTQQVTSH